MENLHINTKEVASNLKKWETPALLGLVNKNTHGKPTSATAEATAATFIGVYGPQS